MVLEASIEEYLIDEVERRGGFTVKLKPDGVRGIPDRLVVLPGAIIFVELKRPKGGVLAKVQKWWHNRLKRLGHPAYIANTREAVDEILRAHTRAS